MWHACSVKYICWTGFPNCCPASTSTSPSCSHLPRDRWRATFHLKLHSHRFQAAAASFCFLPVPLLAPTLNSSELSTVEELFMITFNCLVMLCFMPACDNQKIAQALNWSKKEKGNLDNLIRYCCPPTFPPGDWCTAAERSKASKQEKESWKS